MSYRLGNLVETKPRSEFQTYGFRVLRTRDDRLVHQAQRLRFRVYAEEGFIKEADFTSEALVDPCDASSEHIVVLSPQGEIAGTLRVTLFPTDPLPTERVFRIAPPTVPRQAICDFGKFAISAEFRNRPARILVPILKAALESMIDNGATHALAFFPDRLGEAYKRLGYISSVCEELDEDREILAARQQMEGYFRHDVIRPRIFSGNQILQNIGLRPVIRQADSLQQAQPVRATR